MNGIGVITALMGDIGKEVSDVLFFLLTLITRQSLEFLLLFGLSLSLTGGHIDD